MTGLGTALLGAYVGGILVVLLYELRNCRYGPVFWVLLAVAAVSSSLIAGRLTGFVP
jgi:hypothetical protein